MLDFENNLSFLENKKEREKRNNIVRNNYIKKFKGKNLFKQLGEKPINLDSFLDVCNILLDPDNISTDSLHPEVYKVLDQSIDKVKASFD